MSRMNNKFPRKPAVIWRLLKSYESEMLKGSWQLKFTCNFTSNPSESFSFTSLHKSDWCFSLNKRNVPRCSWTRPASITTIRLGGALRSNHAKSSDKFRSSSFRESLLRELPCSVIFPLGAFRFSGLPEKMILPGRKQRDHKIYHINWNCWGITSFYCFLLLERHEAWKSL